MGKEVIIVLFLLLATMVLIGCKNKKLQENHDVKVVNEPPLPTAILGKTKELEVIVTEEFIIKADGNPTTGFSWFYCGKDTIDGVVLKKDSYHTTSNNPIACGAPGIFSFYFEAKKPGRYDLKFEYKRPWEKDEEPMTENVLIIVK